MTGVVGCALGPRKAGQPLEEEPAVGGIDRLTPFGNGPTGEPGRVNPRRSAEGGHDEPAVFGQHPAADRHRLLDGLERRILGEAAARLRHLDRTGQVCQRVAADPKRPEQLDELPHLAEIGRTKNESHRHAGRFHGLLEHILDSCSDD